MISRNQVSRVYSDGQIDAVTRLALRERYAEARPSSQVWESIRGAIQSDSTRLNLIRATVSDLWTRIWLQSSGAGDVFVDPCCYRYDLHLFLLRQHPMNTRLVC